MKFHRSPAGLTNLHLFVGADVVVFVEGGQHSYTMDDVADGRYSPSSVDLKFWQDMFYVFLRNGRKFQFRAIGSKSTVRSIADLLFSKQISNVWVAMDRDHDCFHGELRVAPGILYTYGHSWENDVCMPEVVEEVFWALVQIARGSVPVREEIEGLFTEIYRDLRRAVYLDILMSFYGDSLLPREKPDSMYLLFGEHRKPYVNRQQLSKLISQLRDTHQRPILRRTEIDLQVFRDCVGCVLACFYHRVLQFLIKRHTNLKNIQKQIVDNLMIEKFVAYLGLNRGGNIFAHYAGQFATLDNKLEDLSKSFSKTKGRLRGLLSFLRSLIPS